MKVFKESVKVRWSDLDPNMHLANSSYMSFTSFARISALEEAGFTMKHLQKWGIGPVIFEEKFYFFKEIFPNSTIHIHTRCTSVSEDLVLFKFEHDLYTEDGKHRAKSIIFGCWLDLKIRKMVQEFPAEMKETLGQFLTPDVEILTKADLKNLPYQAHNIATEEV